MWLTVSDAARPLQHGSAADSQRQCRMTETGDQLETGASWRQQTGDARTLQAATCLMTGVTCTRHFLQTADARRAQTQHEVGYPTAQCQHWSQEDVVSHSDCSTQCSATTHALHQCNRHIIHTLYFVSLQLLTEHKVEVLTDCHSLLSNLWRLTVSVREPRFS